MRRAAIPTISSGAGPHRNGQVMILNFGVLTFCRWICSFRSSAI
jgi:ketopantoate hydroxymethyltransferase